MSKSTMKRLQIQIPDLAKIIEKDYVTKEEYETITAALDIATECLCSIRTELDGTMYYESGYSAQKAMKEIEDLLGEK